MAWWLALSAIGKAAGSAVAGAGASSAAGALGKAAKIGAAVSKMQPKQETVGPPPIAGVVNNPGAHDQAANTMVQELRRNQMIGGMR